MAGSSTIEWTQGDDGSKGMTWNPVRGCIKISPGCKHCYAETFAERWRGIAGHAYEKGFDPRLAPDQLDVPLRWKKPRRIFVNSMSDLFLEEFPDEFIAAVFGVMAACPQHTFQVLTKRADRLPKWFTWALSSRFGQEPSFALQDALKAAGVDSAGRGFQNAWPLPNVHLGVSVEDRKYGLPRIDELRKVPAALRFLSIEPLLEDLGTLDLTGIGWVIVGGESGPGARPFQIEWARSIVEQCRAAKVPVFVKQVGAKPFDRGATGKLVPLKIGHRKGKTPEDWPEDLRVREFPRVTP